MRVHNALDYPLDKGFDAVPNWEYVELLLDDWTLPAPDALWAAAHPPFFYWMAAGLGRALGAPGKEATVHAVRIAGSAAALGIALLAAWGVGRLDPATPRRAFLAAGLLVFLPVHVYMSAMLSEEIWVALLTSGLLVGVALDLAQDRAASSPARAAALGVLGGLALLTKLSGLIGVLAAASAYAVEGWRRGEVRAGLARGLALGAVAAAVGGWFYLRNLVAYGYLYPQDLEVHAVMFRMPPGTRTLVDYLWIPLATFRDPQVFAPDLLRSVWGTTYVTVWFDAHRHFLPGSGEAVTRAGTALAVLGLLPTAAFLAGVARGVRRFLAGPGGPDAVLLAAVALTLAGYVGFTASNPWYATVKGSFLLGLCVPFAWYASEVLADWTRPGASRRWLPVAVWGWLAALAVAVGVTEKTDAPGPAVRVTLE